MRIENINYIAYILFLNLSVVSFLLIILKYLDFLYFIFSYETLIFFAIFSLTFLIFFKSNLDNLRGKSKSLSQNIVDVSPYFFFSLLIVILLNEHFNPSLIIQRSFVINISAISLGFLAIYRKRHKVDYTKTKNEEEIEEKRRYDNFPEIFPRLNRVFLLRNIFRWMYKEGWNYSLSFILILLVSLFLRMWTLNYIEGLDNFTISKVRNLYQNDISYYKYSLLSPSLMLFFSKLFGYSLFSLRLPSVIYSLITLTILYFIAKKINKKVAIITIILFALSPWSIVVSRFTRDYTFDTMIGSIILLISINIINLYRNNKLSYKKSIILSLICISAVYLISILNNRTQTAVVLIFPLLSILFISFIQLKSNPLLNNKRLCLIYLFSGVLFAFAFYLLDISNFEKGIRYHIDYWKYLFDPLVSSPWQWFHGINLRHIIPFIFFVPLIVNLFSNKEIINKLSYFYLIFLSSVLIFVLKFSPHSIDLPTRYIYFIFPIYCLIFATSIYYLTKMFNGKLVAIIFLVIFLTNFTQLIYAVDPYVALEKKGITNLQIDNLGIGRFEMIPVANFVKDLLSKNKEIAIVFDSKFSEFTHLADYEMDPYREVRSLNSSITFNSGFDVGKRMYVESSSWNIHELSTAVNQNSEGYFISKEYCLSDSAREYLIKDETKCLKILKDENLEVNSKQLKFLRAINGYRIYTW